MSDLKELYQEIILDHSKAPQNFHKLETANRTALGHNPLCGDRISLYLELEGERIKDISFEGDGCAISKASTSLMTSAVKGKAEEEVLNLFDKFHQMITGKNDFTPETLGKLDAFQGVVEFPIRVKCAVLSWHTLKAALENGKTVVSTE